MKIFSMAKERRRCQLKAWRKQLKKKPVKYQLKAENVISVKAVKAKERRKRAAAESSMKDVEKLSKETGVSSG
jgi:hypothetical protein